MCEIAAIVSLACQAILAWPGASNNIKTSKIIMKKIAILALTAAAFVSCQQQQQQQVTPEPVAPAPVVEPVKGK